MMVGRLLSFWDGLFSGAMFNFQGVRHRIYFKHILLAGWNFGGISGLLQPLGMDGFLEKSMGTFRSEILWMMDFGEGFNPGKS